MNRDNFTCICDIRLIANINFDQMDYKGGNNYYDITFKENFVNDVDKFTFILKFIQFRNRCTLYKI